MTRPLALVLDFGGVITRTLFETHDVTEKALGLPAGSLAWRGPFDPASDLLWQAMQRDEISERDYWLARTREVGRLVGEEWDRMESFVGRARGADPDAALRPEAVAAVDLAHARGIRLAILSNELDLFYGPQLRRRLSIMRLFEAVVDATHTGILKPDPRAYAAVAEALDLPPGACVFVDDQQRNVAGAERAGMLAVHFDVLSPGQSYRRALGHFGLTLNAAGTIDA